METSTKPKSKHIGRKISRIRELRGIKQDALAEDLGISQQTISRIEKSETIDEETLEKISKALGVEKEAIKNLNEEAIIYNIQNNYEGSNPKANSVSVTNHQCTFNPLDKLIEVMEENKKLYEQLLQSEREKVELLKGQIKH